VLNRRSGWLANSTKYV